MTLFIVLLGVVALYMLQNKLYEKNWNKALLVSVEFEKRQAVKGEKINLIEVITNNKVLPLLILRLKFIMDKNLHFDDMESNFAVSDKCYKNDIFSLLFYQKITRTIPILCTKRGFYVIDEISLVSTNLFFNIQYISNVPVYTELTVYPKMADASRLDIPFKKIMGEILSRRYLYEDPFEFRGIREYMTTDTMSSINWKATARTGKFKVNVHDYTSSQEICILLDLEKETNWESDVFMEECISIAAGLCFKLTEANVSVKMITNGCDLYSKEAVIIESGLSASHIDSILTSLARIDLKLTMQDFTEIINDCADRGQDNTLYVLISVASRNTLQESYQKLAEKNSGALWILPYEHKQEFDIKNCSSVEVLPWEVTVNE